MQASKLTAKQAAERLKVSKDTILRAISKGELSADFDHGSSGAQYWLDWDRVNTWWEDRRNRKRRTLSDTTPAAPASTSNLASDRPFYSIPPQEQQALHQAPEAPQFEVFTALAAPALVPVEVHMQALRLVERGQMQLESLRHELNSTRNILTEQAESLAEKEEQIGRAQ